MRKRQTVLAMILSMTLIVTQSCPFVFAQALSMNSTAGTAAATGAASMSESQAVSAEDSSAGEGRRVVNTFDELRKAAADNEVSIIALGSDIFIDKKLNVNRNKDLVIDGGVNMYGLYESHKLPQGVADYTLTFRGGYKNLTFKNLKMTGVSYGASVHAPVDDARVVFDNIEYEGPALYYGENKGSTGVLTNSKVVLDTFTKGVKYTSEVMHSYNVELNGNVSIVKNETSGNDYDEIFYLSKSGGDLIVGDMANVSIVNYSTAKESIYWSGLMFASGGQANTHKFIVGKGAKFSYVGHGGCVIEEWPLDEFRIGEDAKVEISLSIPNLKKKTEYAKHDNGAYFSADNIIIEKNAAWDYTLKSDVKYKDESMLGVGNLVVEEGAKLRVKAPVNTVAENLVILVGAKPTISLNNPAEVLFYNGNKTGSDTWALAGARSGAGYGLSNAGDSLIHFDGEGVTIWSAENAPIGINEWTVDNTESMRQWGVKPDESFSMAAYMSNIGAIKDTVIKDSAAADIAKELTTLKGVSVIRFTGRNTELISNIYAKHYLLDGVGNLVKRPYYFQSANPLPLINAAEGEYSYEPNLYSMGADENSYCFDEAATQKASANNGCTLSLAEGLIRFAPAAAEVSVFYALDVNNNKIPDYIEGSVAPGQHIIIDTSGAATQFNEGDGFTSGGVEVWLVSTDDAGNIIMKEKGEAGEYHVSPIADGEILGLDDDGKKITVTYKGAAASYEISVAGTDSETDGTGNPGSGTAPGGGAGGTGSGTLPGGGSDGSGSGTLPSGGAGSGGSGEAGGSGNPGSGTLPGGGAGGTGETGSGTLPDGGAGSGGSGEAGGSGNPGSGTLPGGGVGGTGETGSGTLPGGGSGGTGETGSGTLPGGGSGGTGETGSGTLPGGGADGTGSGTLPGGNVGETGTGSAGGSGSGDGSGKPGTGTGGVDNPGGGTTSGSALTPDSGGGSAGGLDGTGSETTSSGAVTPNGGGSDSSGSMNSESKVNQHVIIDTSGAKTQFKSGEKFSADGINVWLVDTDDNGNIIRKEKVNPDEYIVKPITVGQLLDLSDNGKEIIVSYRESETSYIIIVKDDNETEATDSGLEESNSSSDGTGSETTSGSAVTPGDGSGNSGSGTTSGGAVTPDSGSGETGSGMTSGGAVTPGDGSGDSGSVTTSGNGTTDAGTSSSGSTNAENKVSQHIIIDTSGAKTQFKSGEKFSADGINVWLVDTDDNGNIIKKEKVNPDEYIVKPITVGQLLELGDNGKEITISYRESETSYIIIVKGDNETEATDSGLEESNSSSDGTVSETTSGSAVTPGDGSGGTGNVTTSGGAVTPGDGSGDSGSVTTSGGAVTPGDGSGNSGSGTTSGSAVAPSDGSDRTESETTSGSAVTPGDGSGGTGNVTTSGGAVIPSDGSGNSGSGTTSGSAVMPNGSGSGETGSGMTSGGAVTPNDGTGDSKSGITSGGAVMPNGSGSGETGSAVTPSDGSDRTESETTSGSAVTPGNGSGDSGSGTTPNGGSGTTGGSGGSGSSTSGTGGSVDPGKGTTPSNGSGGTTSSGSSTGGMTTDSTASGNAGAGSGNNENAGGTAPSGGGTGVSGGGNNNGSRVNASGNAAGNGSTNGISNGARMDNTSIIGNEDTPAGSSDITDFMSRALSADGQNAAGMWWDPMNSPSQEWPEADITHTMGNSTMSKQLIAQTGDGTSERVQTLTELKEQKVPTFKINAQEVPLFGGNGTAVWALMNLILMLLSLAMTISAASKVIRKREYEIDSEIVEKYGDKAEHKTLAPLRLMEAAMGAVAVMMFVVTENIENLMVIFDKWTWVMAAILVVQAAILIMASKEETNNNMTDDVQVAQ
ncbi:MAG: hypothetical protein LBL49_01700 [Clostridiales Family XIII bacterium]|nr:hypothetical protein [Clostridiales Family XIII bacterium]